MKILKTSDITDINSMPLKSGSLDFIQEAHKENTTSLITQLIGHAPDNTKGYIVQGVGYSNIGANYTVPAGSIYFNGEVFPVIASAFTLLGGQQVFGVISNIPYTNADPVLFGDNVERNVHLNRVITFGSHASGDLLLSNVIKSGVWLNGDIKEIDCTDAYITANFDGTGLGINERQGWAICNGNNGTKNRAGRVSLAYGVGYTTMGTTGGEATHTLTLPEIPAHTHNYTMLDNTTRDYDPESSHTTYNTVDSATYATTSAGGGLAHNNLQPYIVTLFIQKL